MHTLHMLTDRYGPRVTGTPNHEAAAKWAIAEMTSWGMKNAHLEPWDFARAGWLNESATGMIVAPVKENLKFEVLAWTPSTKGTVNCVGDGDRAAARASGIQWLKMQQAGGAAEVDEEALRRGSVRRKKRWSNGWPRRKTRCAGKSYWSARRR